MNMDQAPSSKAYFPADQRETTKRSYCATKIADLSNADFLQFLQVTRNLFLTWPGRLCPSEAITEFFLTPDVFHQHDRQFRNNPEKRNGFPVATPAR
jgi:hypothetical protein